MRCLVFAKRCAKEVLRDPLTIIFGIGFPTVILLLLSVMNLNIPAEAQMTHFEIENLAPGCIVFGFSFLALFGGQLLATDRDTAFLTRLYTSPLRAGDFLFGYALPLLPVGGIQLLCCMVIALCFGLAPTVHFLTLCLFLLPTLLLFVGIGLLFGSMMNARQVGSLCGALLTNLSAWLSGTWFSLDLLGDGFRTVAYCLPFANAVDAARHALTGDFSAAIAPIGIVCAYTMAVLALAVVVFRKKMKQ